MRKQRFGVDWKTVLGIFFMLPVLIAFFFSFLPNDQVLGLPTLETFFEFFTFENYQWVFANIPIFKYVSNSLQMCLIVIVAQSITACLAAYAFAFFKFKGKDTLFQIILIAMMVIYMFVLIGNVHFIFATSLYIFANYMYLDAGKKFWVIPAWAMRAIIAVVASTAVYYGMMIFLGITMP